MTTIGYESGRWWEYTPDGRIPFAPQRLARPTRPPIVSPAVSVYARPEIHGAVLAGSFFAVFFGLLSMLVLIMELL